MNKLIPFLLSAAVLAPLYLSTPVYAQSLNDIQRLEERLNEAKSRGNYGAVNDLEVQLNMARLQYQRNNGLGEVNDRGYYGYGNNQGYYQGYNGQNQGYNGQNQGYNGQNRGYYQNNNKNNRNNRNNKNRNRGWQQNSGYYDQYGRWQRNN